MTARRLRTTMTTATNMLTMLMTMNRNNLKTLRTVKTSISIWTSNGIFAATVQYQRCAITANFEIGAHVSPLLILQKRRKTVHKKLAAEVSLW